MAVLGGLTTAGIAADWTGFRGPNGQAVSTNKDLPVKWSTTENVRWKVKVEGTGHSSPIVWGDRVFLQTASPDATERSLLCLDAKSGKEIWKRSIPGIIFGRNLWQRPYDDALALSRRVYEVMARYPA